MAKFTATVGETSRIIHVFIQDSASSSGAGKTGLGYQTENLACKYVRAGGTLQSVTLEDITTLGTYAAPTSNAYMRFKEVNSASPTQGLYEIHVHNDWLAAGAPTIVIMLGGATGMAQLPIEIEIGGPPVQFKRNVAWANFVFPMYDTNGDLKSGLTVTGQISQDGGSFAALTNSVSEIGTTGWYKVSLTQAEMNAVMIALKFTATGAKSQNYAIVTQP